MIDQIRIWTEDVLKLFTFQGSSLNIATHIILVLFSFLVAFLVGLILKRIFIPLIQRFTLKTKVVWDDIVFNRRVLSSAFNIIPAIILWSLLPSIFSQSSVVESLLIKLTSLYITVMSARLFTEIFNSIKGIDKDDTSAFRQYLHTFCSVAKIIVIFLSCIVAFAILLEKNPITLLAGLGATSAVLMLVFQDTIQGLVAGIRLINNDMLRKGDWITVPGTEADGNVEEISLTTVKVRNFDNTIVTVTPQVLVSSSFKNWVGMQKSPGRRVQRRVYYDFRSIRIIDQKDIDLLVNKGYFKSGELTTGEINMTLYRRYIEKMLSKDTMVNPEMTLMVRQLEVSGIGLPLEFYFFLRDKEWVEYEHNLSTIMEKIYALTSDFGLVIYQQQLPSATLCP